MLIGIDVGTTAVKAALFDENGTALRQFGETYPTHRPAPGQVEQNPRDWMALVVRALAELSRGVTIHAIGLCSQVNTHVFVDASGEALFPAISWQDTRCAEEATEIDARIHVDDKLGWWGAPFPVDASHVLARMSHIKKHYPDIWAKTHLVLAPKDYCLMQLTAQAVADPMTNFGILDQNLQLIPQLLMHVPGAAERLPLIQSFTSIAGSIRNGLPCAGVPIVTGAMDAWSGLLGAGVHQNGHGLYLSGTSEILGLVSRHRTPTPGVIAFAECDGISLHAGPTQSGGASIHWASRILGLNLNSFLACAADAKADHVPLFLPHLEGERAPLWDSAAKGSFTRLTSVTGPAEFARAVLEGVGYSARLVFDRLEISAGRAANMIHHSGGGSTSDLWCQIRADILQKPIRRTATRDAGVLGAALMAGVGIGIFASLTHAADTFVQFDRTFFPDPKTQPRHNAQYAAYQLAYEQLKPVNKLDIPDTDQPPKIN